MLFWGSVTVLWLEKSIINLGMLQMLFSILLPKESGKNGCGSSQDGRHSNLKSENHTGLQGGLVLVNSEQSVPEASTHASPVLGFPNLPLLRWTARLSLWATRKEACAVRILLPWQRCAHPDSTSKVNEGSIRQLVGNPSQAYRSEQGEQGSRQQGAHIGSILSGWPAAWLSCCAKFRGSFSLWAQAG